MAQTQSELLDEIAELENLPKLPFTEAAIEDFLNGKKFRRIPKYFYAVGTEIAKVELSLNKELMKLKKDIIFCADGANTLAYISEIGKKYKSPSDVFFDRYN
jgi:hypothetical protein